MFWDQQFDAFEAENNCTVEVTILPWDGYKQKVTTGLISDQGPDFAITLAAAASQKAQEHYRAQDHCQ